MKLLAASPGDLDEIYLMGYDTWSEGRTVDDYLDACRTNPEYRAGRWFRLVNDHGVAVASLIRYELPAIGGYRVSGLGCIATAAAHRRQGHAATLIRLVLAEMADRDAVFLFSDITPSYYEAFGFQALPSAFQHTPGSVCMVRLRNGLNIDHLLQHPDRLPAYF